MKLPAPEYAGPARLEIPCQTGDCIAAAAFLVEHPCHDESPKGLPPLYLCDGCRQTYAVFFEVEGCRIRRLVITEGETHVAGHQTRSDRRHLPRA